jgi:hypothetical protein
MARSLWYLFFSIIGTPLVKIIDHDSVEMNVQETLKLSFIVLICNCLLVSFLLVGRACLLSKIYENTFEMECKIILSIYTPSSYNHLVISRGLHNREVIPSSKQNRGRAKYVTVMDG